MGSVACCCSASHGSFDVEDLNAQNNAQSACSFPLSAVRLNSERDVALAPAYEDLLTALRAFKLGNTSEAYEYLEAAKELLADAEDCDGKEQLMQAYDTDPDLQAMKSSLAYRSRFANMLRSASVEDVDYSVQRLATDILGFGHQASNEASGDKEASAEYNAMIRMLSKKSISGYSLRTRSLRQHSVDEAAIMTQDWGVDRLLSEQSANIVPHLQQKLDAIVFLAKRFHTLEAFRDMKQLELDVAVALDFVSSNPWYAFAEEVNVFAANFGKDNRIRNLEKAHARVLKACESIGAGAEDIASDNRWASLTFVNPLLGRDFQCDLHLRHLEGTEIDRTGPSTQLVSYCKLYRFPLTVAQTTALFREVDLVQKDMIPDCVLAEGKIGGPDELCSSLLHFATNPPLLPVSLDNHVLREFVKCDVCPLEGGSGPGVLMVENQLDRTLSDFEGFAMFRAASGVQQFGSTAIYLTPSSTPGMTDMIAVSRFALPVPKWLAPLSLWKRAVAEVFRKFFATLKVSVIDTMDQLGFEHRIQTTPDLYKALGGLTPPAV